MAIPSASSGQALGGSGHARARAGSPWHAAGCGAAARAGRTALDLGRFLFGPNTARTIVRAATIGVGRTDVFAPPSLRTGQAGFPHPALQSVVLPSRGLTHRGMGCNQGEQPTLGEEGIGPALMVDAASGAALALAFTQDASQPHAQPPIQLRKRPEAAVLEVSKPALQRPVQVRDDGRETIPMATPGLGAQRVLQLIQALASGPDRYWTAAD